MKKEDFVFAIGFDGNKAIVDKRSRSRYKKLSTRELADQGLFREAYRSAVFEENEEDGLYVLEKFNAVSRVKYSQRRDLMKVFGVQKPSADITGIRAV